MSIPILFPKTPVTAITWYWLMIPAYAVLNLLTVLVSPAAESTILAYVLMSAGSSLALWMYPKLGLATQEKTLLQDWKNPMLVMWFRGTLLVLISTILIPILLQSLGFQQEQAVHILVTLIMPWTLGFLVASGFSLIIYAILYQSLTQFLKFLQN